MRTDRMQMIQSTSPQMRSMKTKSSSVAGPTRLTLTTQRWRRRSELPTSALHSVVSLNDRNVSVNKEAA